MFLNKRMIVFLVGCIGVRLLIALVARWVGKNANWALPFMGALALLVSVGFISIFLGDFRKVGREAGGKIWWNDFRPIHGVMYLLFAIYAFKRRAYSWRVLLVDAIIGLLLWGRHRLL